MIEGIIIALKNKKTTAQATSGGVRVFGTGAWSLKSKKVHGNSSRNSGKCRSGWRELRQREISFGGKT